LNYIDMMKMDLGTGSEEKIFHLNDKDIELIVSLLHEECDHHVYHKNGFKNPDQEVFKERYDHMQDLIMELTK
tara:strand:+ start:521 stop:739 length:219 start_codon:yes stop_codon:yes gene_type:complete